MPSLVPSTDTSRPEQKLGPSPHRTTARTPRSPPTWSAASASDSNMALSSALCLPARTIVTVATWSATAIETLSSRIG